MKIIDIHRNDIHSLTMIFEEGEKCFCCNKVFDKKTDVVQKFKSEKEYQEYVSSLKHYWNIEINK